MTREEFERRRQHLDQELRAGIEALETAHRFQVRALELTWMLIARDDAEPAAAIPVSPPEPPERQSPGALREKLAEVFADLPEVFDRNDVRRLLGHTPDRSSLYRVLRELVYAGSLKIQKRGEGRMPTRYAKREGETQNRGLPP
jgi:hypothetical protein